MDDRREPFGMPFANREVAVIVANELNRHDRGIWFYTVERQIEGKRWIIVRDGRELSAQGRATDVAARSGPSLPPKETVNEQIQSSEAFR
jgi:hypothetical protein